MAMPKLDVGLQKVRSGDRRKLDLVGWESAFSKHRRRR